MSSSEAFELAESIKDFVEACGGRRPTATDLAAAGPICTANQAVSAAAAKWALAEGAPMRAAAGELMSIDTVTTEDIFSELRRRFRGVLLSAVRDIDGTRESSIVWWDGGLVAALGLGEVAMIRLRQVQGRANVGPEHGSSA